MRVIVIGSKGAMGRWFVRFFQATHHEVIGIDVHTHLDHERAGLLSEAEFVLIAVPINAMAEVIGEVTEHLRGSCVLCEISSIKGSTVDLLREAASGDIIPLSIHPLFGHGASLSNNRIAVIPVLDAPAEVDLAAQVFSENEIFLVDAKDNDRVAALVISFPYLVHVAMASVYQHEDMGLLEKLGGTTFEIQRMLLGAIMYQSADLHWQMFSSNSVMSDIIDSFREALDEAKMKLESTDPSCFHDYYDAVKSEIVKQVDLGKTYAEFNACVSFLRFRDCKRL